MKKIYNSPVVTVVKMQTVGMIATSTSQSLGGAPDYSGGGTLTGSRGGSWWDDDEDN